MVFCPSVALLGATLFVLFAGGERVGLKNTLHHCPRLNARLG